MSSNGRTYQQNLVMERLCGGLKLIESANDGLEARATKILAGSTAAVAVVTGVGILPKSVVDIGTGILDAAIISILCISTLAMFWLAVKLWGPQSAIATTCDDVQKLYHSYILESEDVAFNNALIDTSIALKHAKWANEIKGRLVRYMAWVLQFQVALLAIGAILKLIQKNEMLVRIFS